MEHRLLKVGEIAKKGDESFFVDTNTWSDKDVIIGATVIMADAPIRRQIKELPKQILLDTFALEAIKMYTNLFMKMSDITEKK